MLSRTRLSLVEGNENSVEVNDAELSRPIVGVLQPGVRMNDAPARILLVQGVNAIHPDPAGRPLDEVAVVASGEIEFDAVALQNGKPRLLVEASEAERGGVEDDGGRDIQR